MFRCQICEKIVPPKTRQQKVTLLTRPKVYASRGPDPTERHRGRTFRGRGRPKAEPRDRGGTGFEIVQEVSGRKWRKTYAYREYLRVLNAGTETG